MKIKYNISGLVLGICWGGGDAAYPAKKSSGEKLKLLLRQANDYLQTGALDAGMGFESLKGAILKIETIKRVDIDNEPFFNKRVDSPC
jgi:hypothetical protein